jgi:hypothetical protein
MRTMLVLNLLTALLSIGVFLWLWSGGVQWLK